MTSLRKPNARAACAVHARKPLEPLCSGLAPLPEARCPLRLPARGPRCCPAWYKAGGCPTPAARRGS